MSGRFSRSRHHDGGLPPTRQSPQPEPRCHDCGAPATHEVQTTVLRLNPFGPPRPGANQHQTTHVTGVTDFACDDCARRLMAMLGKQPWRIVTTTPGTPTGASSAPAPAPTRGGTSGSTAPRSVAPSKPDAARMRPGDRLIASGARLPSDPMVQATPVAETLRATLQDLARFGRGVRESIKGMD